MAAINQICDEKNLPPEVVIEAIEAALAAAYKKDYGKKDQEVEVKFNEETGEAQVYTLKEVVPEVEDEFLQISLKDAQKIDKKTKLGNKVRIEETPVDYGRIAAQTAKQVIIQRIREAERDIVFSEYKDKEGELLVGSVQRVEGNNVFVDLGRATGIMFAADQIPGERYYIGQRIKVYLVSVDKNIKGPNITLSRSHPDFVRRLFEMEVPEIPAGIVEIKGISREAGSRSKVAVVSKQEGVDPVGSCVGQRGTRVQAIISELGEEKIDIILWDEDLAKYISNALSPAKVSEIKINEKNKEAKVKVPTDQLSLAIGKSGQNVRLAAKLTGWKIDIEGAESKEQEAENKKQEEGEEVKSKKEKVKSDEKIEAREEVKETKEQKNREAEEQESDKEGKKSSDASVGAPITNREAISDNDEEEAEKSQGD